MSEAETEVRPQLEIKPEVGRMIDVIDLAERIAQDRHGISIQGLREQAEQAGGDYSKIIEVVGRAGELVGPEDEYVADYKEWQETRKAGSHQMNFRDWRMQKREAYRQEYERLKAESSKS